MKRRDIKVWAAVAGGTLLSVWACTQATSPGSPSGPEHTQTAAADGAGKLFASSVPVGPSARPVGPTTKPVGPSTRPVGPTTRPVGPSPTPVGGGTPPPTPSPSPSASPSSGTCPAISVSLNDRVNSTGNQLVASVAASTLGACVIDRVRLDFHVQATPNLNAFTQGLRATLRRRPATGLPESVVLFSLTSATPLIGPGLGLDCGQRTTFDDAGVSFPTEPPYSDTYRPVGSFGQPGFSAFEGDNPTANWDVIIDWDPPPTTVQQSMLCMTLTLTLRSAAPLTGLGEGE